MFVCVGMQGCVYNVCVHACVHCCLWEQRFFVSQFDREKPTDLKKMGKPLFGMCWIFLGGSLSAHHPSMPMVELMLGSSVDASWAGWLQIREGLCVGQQRCGK